MTSFVRQKKSRFWPKWIIGQNMSFWNSVTLEGFPLGLTVKLTFFSWLLTLPDFLGFDPSFESRTSNNAKIIKKGWKITAGCYSVECTFWQSRVALSLVKCARRGAEKRGETKRSNFDDDLSLSIENWCHHISQVFSGWKVYLSRLLSKKIHLSLAHNSVWQNPYEAIGLTKTVVVAIVKKWKQLI